MSDQFLSISDDFCFYTLEGEGEYVGYPSVFLRLAGCNLTCKGFASDDSPHGCDSYVSWSVKNRMTFEQIAEMLEKNEYNRYLQAGAIFKITGGEPLIQQKRLVKFIQYLINRWGFIPKIDFETNATVIPDNYWRDIGATFTTSPKLSSNGDPEHIRYKPNVLRWHVANGSGFKFVVSSQQDIDEIIQKYVYNEEITVPPHRVWLMPCCGSRKEHIENAAKVAEYCKYYGFKFSPRLQLIIWDKALKV